MSVLEKRDCRGRSRGAGRVDDFVVAVECGGAADKIETRIARIVTDFGDRFAGLDLQESAEAGATIVEGNQIRNCGHGG